MNRSIPFVLSLALVGSAAWAEDAAQPAQPDAAQAPDQAGASKDAAAAQDPAAAAADPAQPAAGRESGQQQDPAQMFIKDMYSHNLYEVQLSQMAQQQAQDDQVKQLAEMLIKDHTQANEELKQLAQGAGVQVEEKLDPVHQAKLDKFQKCSPADFSRKYANDQVAGHMVAVLELTYQSKNAQDEKVKQFATKMLPKMQQHLKQVTEIATMQAGGTGADGEAQPASERQTTDPAPSSPQDPATPGERGTDDASGAPAKPGQDAAGDPAAETPQAK